VYSGSRIVFFMSYVLRIMVKSGLNKNCVLSRYLIGHL